MKVFIPIDYCYSHYLSDNLLAKIEEINANTQDATKC